MKVWHLVACSIPMGLAAALLALAVDPPDPTTDTPRHVAQRQERTQEPAESRAERCAFYQQQDVREAYEELKRRLAVGTLTATERYAAKEALGRMDINLSAC